eukprot:15470676-Alexandrium_andersonii.AAC.1
MSSVLTPQKLVSRATKAVLVQVSSLKNTWDQKLGQSGMSVDMPGCDGREFHEKVPGESGWE